MQSITVSTPAKETTGRRRWASLFAFAFATVVDNTEGSMINGLFPTIRQALGLSLVDLSLLTNANKLVSALLAPLWAMAADRYNRKKILVFVTGLWGFWTVSVGLARTFSELLILYFIASLGSVASGPIIMSSVSDLFADRERGRALGIFGALSIILAAVAAPVLSQFARLEAWRSGYFLVGGASILSGVLIWQFFQDPGRGAAEIRPGAYVRTSPSVRWRDFARLAYIPTLRFLFLQKFLNAGMLIWSFGAVYMVDVFGYNNQQAILVMAVPQLFGGILGNILGGVIGDRAHQRHPYHGRIALLQLGFLCSALAGYLSTQVHWRAVGVFYLTFFTWGFFANLSTGLDRPMVAAVTPPELRSTAFGVWMGTGDSLASLLLVSLVGLLGERYGLQPVFLWLMSGVMFLRVLAWFAAYRTYPIDAERMRAGLLSSSQEINLEVPR